MLNQKIGDPPRDSLMAIPSATTGWGMARIDLDGIVIDPRLVEKFPFKTLYESCSIPLEQTGERVRVAISNPNDFAALDELTAFSGFLLDPVLADANQIRTLLRQTLGVGGGMVANGSELEDTSVDPLQTALDATENATIVRFTRELLHDAYIQGASDIHIEPEDGFLSIRFRIDGVLRPQFVPPEVHSHQDAIISRVKILAKLNIAERRLPQDGGFQLDLPDAQIDIRVSVIPMRHGEGIVLRILDKSRMNFSLESLGFPDALRLEWDKLIRKSSGMMLVTGPTGSGKTTTLYGSISLLRGPDLKIITLEDPIEYTIAGVNQIQVQPNIGLTFASGLRSVLRHDPDVILIGEIRDKETASNAVQSALTGHLVFSTIHTNDAASAVTRLVDMGVEPFLVAATLNGVIAQRLVRKLCPKCRQKVDFNDVELPSDFRVRSSDTIFMAAGCRACHGIGYVGQVAVYELMVIDDSIRKLALQGAAPHEIREYAIGKGMTTMRQSGWQKVLAGMTSIEEVLRATSVEL